MTSIRGRGAEPLGRRLALAAASVLIALLLALGVAEGVLRLLGAGEGPPAAETETTWRTLVHRRSEVPGLTYELTPNVDADTAHGHIRTNSFGMRDRERQLTPAPLALRIAALGDSFTFGFGVAAEEAYPAVLEALLSRRAAAGKSAEVLNFGVGGYSSRDEAAALAGKVRPFKPRLVLVGYVLNDPEVRPNQPLHAHFAARSAEGELRLSWLLGRAEERLRVAQFGGGNPIRALHRDPESWDSVLAAFERMGTLSREDGFRVLVAIFPLFPGDDWRGYDFADLHHQVEEAARAAGLEALDLLPVFERHPPGQLRLSAEDRHPNTLGHRLAAEAICERICALESGWCQPE